MSQQPRDIYSDDPDHRVDRLAREFIATVYVQDPDSDGEIYDAHDMRAAYVAGYQQGAGPGAR